MIILILIFVGVFLLFRKSRAWPLADQKALGYGFDALLALMGLFTGSIILIALALVLFVLDIRRFSHGNPSSGGSSDDSVNGPPLPPYSSNFGTTRDDHEMS